MAIRMPLIAHQYFLKKLNEMEDAPWWAYFQAPHDLSTNEDTMHGKDRQDESNKFTSVNTDDTLFQTKLKKTDWKTALAQVFQHIANSANEGFFALIAKPHGSLTKNDSAIKKCREFGAIFNLDNEFTPQAALGYLIENQSILKIADVYLDVVIRINETHFNKVDEWQATPFADQHVMVSDFIKDCEIPMVFSCPATELSCAPFVFVSAGKHGAKHEHDLDYTEMITAGMEEAENLVPLMTFSDANGIGKTYVYAITYPPGISASQQIEWQDVASRRLLSVITAEHSEFDPTPLMRLPRLTDTIWTSNKKATLKEFDNATHATMTAFMTEDEFNKTFGINKEAI